MTLNTSRTNKTLNPILTISYPDLPVSARRDDILEALKKNRVVILCGETGSGKTTQIPKMCLELGVRPGKLIGCTQPRRIAARSVATRIAHELGSELGGLVGYKVRFTDKVRHDTAIKIMTDGILLAESQGDPLLSRYDTIIIDEAHERSLNIDFLLGYLQTLVQKRNDLRVVITSATIDAERFSKHFNNAPVIEVSGRTYPVEIRWRPIEREEGEEGRKPSGKTTSHSTKPASGQVAGYPQPSPRSGGGSKRDAQGDLTAAILDATDELARLGPGDILVFLPGEREIRDAAEALRKHHPPGTEILPLFSRLSVAEQDAIFRPSQELRRIVLATNVAETSLTVPGIRYVIDPGTARVKRYSARNKVEQLLIEKISQASANQRAGRCGRVADGVCIRLYDETDFGNRPRFTDPELLRSSLAGVILRMKSLGLGDVVGFPFIDAPSTRLVTDGYQLLAELHALDEQGQLTDIGRKLSKLPLDPRIARMLLAAERQRCVREVLIIASALSAQDPRDRPMERAQAADEKHRLFADERSDFMGWLKLWRWYEEQVQHKKTNRQLQTLLQDHFLSPRRMREWRDIHSQLHAQTSELGLRENEKDAGYDAIHQALLTGLLGNIGFKSDDAKGRPKPGEGNYQGARGIKLSIHPGSALAKKAPKWIMGAELTDTGRLLARTVAEVRPEWIEAAGQHLLTRMYIEPHWEKDGARVVAFERVSLYGITLAPRRKIHYGSIDPELSRELFIRGALVAGDYDTRAPWFIHNRTLIKEIEDLEHKARKSGVWLDEERIFRVFDARIPPGIHNGAAFEKWRAEVEATNPKFLFLQRDDILGEGLGADHNLFPETLVVDGVTCKFTYRFEPGHVLDGVTLTLPLYLLNRVEPAVIDWLVPGLIREKLTLLLKSLPKDKRRPLIPLPDAVTAFLSVAKPGEQILTEALAAFIRKKTGADIRHEDWTSELPLHLQMNLRVVDDSGQELASSRDLVALRQQLGGAASITYGSQADEDGFEQTGLTGWTFGDLPEQVKFSRGGRELIGFPALVDTGDAVDLRLLDTAETAGQETRRGVVRLLRLALIAQFRQLDKDLARETALAMKYRNFGSADSLRTELTNAIATRALLGEDDLPRTEKAFNKQKERAKPRIAVVKQALLRDVVEILDLHAQVAARLNSKPQFVAAMRDETAHLAALVFPGFITATPWGHLKDLPRYMRGILKRLEKLPASEQRDSRGMANVLTLQNKYLARRSQVKGEPPTALDAFRWHLEELRISLFAQELKTPYPVSAKRLDKLWEELARQPLN
ncbi:MAG: ATP-dependent RNA helicase HrpA [Thiobacillus sp.]|nr:ATP-dependent RNA helicase HrpA [Thiobacillus sp.]